MTHNRHIDAEFDAELASLKERISSMGTLAGAHVERVLNAYSNEDAGEAAAIIAADRIVNQMELAIDEQCVRMLVLRQPAASDLRFIAAALKMVTDLERIGDLAVNMAERVLVLVGQPRFGAWKEFPELCARAQDMLREALAAFVAGDAARAARVLSADEAIDAQAARLIGELQTEMQSTPSRIRSGVAAIFLVKHVERMADHTTNIAELVIYYVLGHDIRHSRLADTSLRAL